MSEQHGRKLSAWPPRTGIDAAIDRAVREIMDVDPDAAFRARVLARLERRPAGWSAWAPGRMAMAGISVVLVLIAGVLLRTPAPHVAPGPQPIAIKDVPAPGAAASVTPEPSSRAATATAAAVPPAPPRRHEVRANVTQQLARGLLTATVASEEPAEPIDAVPGIDPLTVEPIAAPSIAATPLTIAPIASITAVQIAPLSPQLQRD